MGGQDGKTSGNGPAQPASKRSARTPRSRTCGLMVRGEVYYLRLKVPRHLQSQIGRTHLCRSLKTGRRSEAVREARLIAADFERLLRGSPDTGTDGRQSRPEARMATMTIIEPLATQKTLRGLLAAFLADPTKVRSTKTHTIYENAVAIAGEVLGLDTPLRSIDREGCRSLLDMLRWLPSNATKRFPRLSAVQASEMARSKKLTSTLSHASANGYMNRLSALLNFAVNEGYIDRNPARGLRIANPTHRRDRRLPFSNDQLRSIFNAPLYRGCVDDRHGYADIGAARPRRARFLGAPDRPLRRDEAQRNLPTGCRRHPPC